MSDIKKVLKDWPDPWRVEFHGSAGRDFIMDANDQVIPLSIIMAVLKARAALADDGWRDISTAPKDGTPILLCRPGMKHPWEARWKYVGPRAGERWQSTFGALTFEPTLWHPLPAPPKGPGHD